VPLSTQARTLGKIAIIIATATKHKINRIIISILFPSSDPEAFHTGNYTEIFPQTKKPAKGGYLSQRRFI